MKQETRSHLGTLALLSEQDAPLCLDHIVGSGADVMMIRGASETLALGPWRYQPVMILIWLSPSNVTTSNLVECGAFRAPAGLGG